MHQCDVLILGAGPAGATTALTLRKAYPHLSIMMIEANDVHAARPGEILNEDAVPILRQLALMDFFKDQKHPPIAGSDDDNIRSAPYSFSDLAPHCGWHLDRGRFDSMLSGYAAASGTFFFRGSLHSVQFLADGRWQVTAQSATAKQTTVARFVVDATGRHARFASEIGIPQLTYDSMIGIVRVIALEEHTKLNGFEPMIEPFEHGWWYSSLTGNKQLAIVAMTDADIGKRLQLTHVTNWTEQMLQSPRTSARVQGITMRGDLSIRAANTRGLHNTCGESWLAVGDAASSFDPVTSDGITRALRLGMQAAHVIGSHLSGKTTAIIGYQAEMQSEFELNLTRRAEIYRSESRWKNSAFWTRRQAQPALSSKTQARKTKLSISGNESADNEITSNSAVAIRTQ
jgi:flavin-dependent dehydrogenase